MRYTARVGHHHRLMTLSETADYLRVSIRTVQRWIDAGLIVASRPGRIVLVDRNSCERLIADSRIVATRAKSSE